MGKTKERGKYQGVSLPVPFIQEIKTHILNDGKYKSIAEFIKEAVREKMYTDKFMAREVPVLGQPGKKILKLPKEVGTVKGTVGVKNLENMSIPPDVDMEKLVTTIVVTVLANLKEIKTSGKTKNNTGNGHGLS